MPSMGDELDIAARAMGEGDLTHAAQHLANAVELGPDRDDVARAVDAFVDAAGDDALSIVAPDALGNTPGWIALRALLFAKQSRWDEAVAALLSVLAAAPSSSYASLLLDWLDDDDVRAAISPDDFAALARPALSGASGEAADDLLAALHLLYRAHPDAELLFFVLCVAIRKRGEVGQARVMAEARVRSHPSARADIALAGVRRAAGELEAAIALYERAAARSTEHAGALLDAGDLWTQLGDLAKALDAYERALAIRGDDEWARSSAEYLRVLRDDDRAARASLLARASAPGASARAVELATRVAPFEVAIPPRPEGSVSAVRDALAREAVRVELRLSSLEAPSALLAARRALRGRELRVTVNDVPSPDPRDPIGEVDFVLWKYPSSGALGWLTGARAFEAKPGVPPPRPSSAEAIAALAERPYERERWCRDAEAIARSIGPDAIREACAAMVHPLEARAGHAEWDWIFRVQVAAALVVARADAEWPGPRWEALCSIVLGPVDWVVTAALAAVTEIALREPPAYTVVYGFLAEMLRLRPMSPIVQACIAHPVVGLALRLPGLPELTPLFLQLRRKIELGRA